MSGGAQTLQPQKSPEAVGIISPLSAFGDLRNTELTPIFQYSFEYTVDNAALNSKILVNGGTVTQDSAMAVIKSSTTTGSTACLQTRREAKFKSGFGALLRFTTLFETGGVAATEQIIGVADESGSSEAFKNGFFIGFIGAAFGLHKYQNDVLVTVVQADWDDPLDGTGASGMTLDTSKLNLWAFSGDFGGEANLFIKDSSSGLNIKAHALKFANINISPPVFMPHFHGLAFVDNKATTTDLVIKTSAFAYFIEGKTEPSLTYQPQQSTGTKSKSSVTSEVAILTIRNKTTYASKTNFIELLLENFTCSVEASSANNLAEVRLVLNATLGGTPAYADINTTDSVVEIDIAGTTVADGKELITFPLAGKNDRGSIALIPLKLLLEHGDTITVAGNSENSATIKGSVLWKELF